MAQQRKRTGQREAAARALDALGRGADNGIRIARTLYDRWRGASAPARPALAPPAPAASTAGPTLAAAPSPAPPAPAAAERAPDPEPPASSGPDGDLSAIEVRDLRAELARELERLAGAEIAASRGEGVPPDGPDDRAAESPAPDTHA